MSSTSAVHHVATFTLPTGIDSKRRSAVAQLPPFKGNCGALLSSRSSFQVAKSEAE
jgi:hypothetical protein